MSGSSSTIKISCAIGSFHGCGRQGQRGHGTGTVARTIIECDRSAMVLHDLLHNGKTETSPFRLVSDIRFREAVAIVLWEANAVVGNGDADKAIHDVYTDRNKARGLCPLDPRRRAAAVVSAARRESTCRARGL